MSFTVQRFIQFFEEVHGHTPFRWQQRLASEVLEGEWPKQIALPTAAGKTSVIDIAVFAMAAKERPDFRRVFFVVDRRLVVDEAGQRARKIAEALKKAEGEACREVAEALTRLGGSDVALEVANLRGGAVKTGEWARSLEQPMVCCSTVDQVGSALLFRSYGARSPRGWPIHAAMAGTESLIVVDEAHLSGPFVETVEAVRELSSHKTAASYAKWKGVEYDGSAAKEGPKVTVMSATLGGGGRRFEMTKAEREEPLIARRIAAAKPATLAACEEGEFAAKAAAEARRLAAKGHKVVAVVVNRVDRARDVFERLKGDTLLLIGRSRPWDRAELWKEWEPRLKTGRIREEAGETRFVVATQCIEVGVDVDFDALVTEAASLDALRQRFGRLDRLGEYGRAEATILRAVPENDDERKDDPVYGTALEATWKQLEKWEKAGQKAKKVKKGKKVRKPEEGEESAAGVDFGVAAMDALMAGLDDKARTVLAMKPRHAPVLMPAHLDLMVQTSIHPEPDVDPAPFLHGIETGPGDVEVVWRAELNEREPKYWAELVGVIPPVSLEKMSVPAWHVRRWLKKERGVTLADVEGVRAGRDASTEGTGRMALCWRGSGESELMAAGRIRPGMTIVVPTEYGGADRFGWKPSSLEPATDIAGEANEVARGRVVVRAVAGLGAGWDAARMKLRGWSEDDDQTLQELLGGLGQGLPDKEEELVWLRRALARLSEDKEVEAIMDPEFPEQVAAVRGKRKKAAEGEHEQDTERSSLTRRVGLWAHMSEVGMLAGASARAAGLEERLALTVDWAGQTHDLGKADPRFQRWLRNGASGPELLAKSRLNPSQMEKARVAAGWPKGGRHEYLSVPLALIMTEGKGLDNDLLAHLVASHHGWCRPFAKWVDDRSLDTVRVEWDGRMLEAPAASRMAELGSGVVERFWRLNWRFGWYGLARLEAMVRLADHRQSEKEDLE